jgi:hypothetical protein
MIMASLLSSYTSRSVSLSATLSANPLRFHLAMPTRQLAAGDDRERTLREQNAKLRDTIAAMREEGATMSVRAQQLEEQVEVRMIRVSALCR